MVTLYIKRYEQDILKEQLFNNIKASLLEIAFGYGSYLNARKKIHTVKELALIALGIQQKIEGTNLEYIDSKLNKGDRERFIHLAKSTTSEEIIDDVEYANYIFNRGLAIILDIVEVSQEVYPSDVVIGSSLYMSSLARAFRKITEIIDNIKIIPGYKFTYLDTNSETYIYLVYVVCNNDVVLKLSGDTSFGELTCNRSDKKLLETVLEKYTAMAELADARRLRELEESTPSFF